jgi:two-component system chemotaxis response regulator CheY
MPEVPKRIALVGHCGPDSYALRAAISGIVPNSQVVFAPDDATLAAELPNTQLLLINRRLDGDYAACSGVELIRSLAASPQRPALMLISNYPEAQQQAVAAGALPGFGKRALYADETRRRVLAALGLS